MQQKKEDKHKLLYVVHCRTQNWSSTSRPDPYTSSILFSRFLGMRCDTESLFSVTWLNISNLSFEQSFRDSSQVQSPFQSVYRYLGNLDKALKWAEAFTFLWGGWGLVLHVRVCQCGSAHAAAQPLSCERHWAPPVLWAHAGWKTGFSPQLTGVLNDPWISLFYI